MTDTHQLLSNLNSGINTISDVPDEMVLQTNLLGDEAAIKQRLLAYRNAGVTTLRLTPAGENLSKRLDTLGRAIELIKKLDN